MILSLVFQTNTAGLNENAGFKTEGVYDVKDLQKKLAEIGQNTMTPSIHMDILPLIFEGKDIVAARIHELPQSEKPCFRTQDGMSRGSFTRVGDCDEHMTSYEIYALQVIEKVYGKICDQSNVLNLMI